MDFWEKLANNYYKNLKPYPREPTRPHLKESATAAEHRAHADLLDAYAQALCEFQRAKNDWLAESSKLENQFQSDLEAYYEMTGHPKAGLLYWKAYDRGHSGGLQEVANAYSDLVELVK